MVPRKGVMRWTELALVVSRNTACSANPYGAFDSPDKSRSLVQVKWDAPFLAVNKSDSVDREGIKKGAILLRRRTIPFQDLSSKKG
jgi:hypothetical protein